MAADRGGHVLALPDDLHLAGRLGQFVTHSGPEDRVVVDEHDAPGTLVLRSLLGLAEAHAFISNRISVPSPGAERSVADPP